MSKIIVDKKINQETLEFKILKPLEKKGFNNETLSSRTKKCKSVAKSFFLTK